MSISSDNRQDEMRVAGSFQDPAGYVFRENGELRRHVNASFAEDYRMLMSSGLYEGLAGDGLLVEHEEVNETDGGIVIRPEEVPFISYPFEWCFSQIKDAALLTLDIQLRALECGMSLKDATAYNVQFTGVRPIFIDTLSFARYVDGEPWVAYRQFCEHFLCPLLLIQNGQFGLTRSMPSLLDGIPVTDTSKALPLKSWLSRGVLSHVHLHARAHRSHARNAASTAESKVPARGMRWMIEDLRHFVAGLSLPAGASTWSHYTENRNYSDQAMAEKRRLVSSFLAAGEAGRVLDAGANTGEFSRLASAHSKLVLSADIDPLAVERNYVDLREADEENIIPVVMDIACPSPSVGWANAERERFFDRTKADTVLALALVHHLTIGKNVPMEMVASFFASLGGSLIIEFVGEEDAMVKLLFDQKRGPVHPYDRDRFEQAFSQHYDIAEKHQAGDAQRWIYRMIQKTSKATS